MAKEKINYYDITTLWNTKAQYIIPIGQRSNGKSYSARGKVIENFKNNKEKFVYLRRWKEDIKTKSVENYFDKPQLKKIIGRDVADTVKAQQNNIYLAKTDEDGNIIKGEQIGYYLALNECERYKSWVFENVTTIIFEEFITDQMYLVDEPKLLQQIVSTIARMNSVRVILIGNTLSRVCPYFSEWCLEGVLKQKQNTIEIYHFHVEDGTIDIAVENCGTTNYKNTMFFGQTAKQIVSGEWDTYNLPSRPKGNWETVYEILVKYQSFNFIMQLQVDDIGNKIVFIYPSTNDRKIDRVIQEDFANNIMINNRLKNNIKAEVLISDCFRNNKVCYSDNLTGTDFKHVKEAFRFI